jgi:cyclopropane fatty-acyl-phospholipid synthase-like methyltransferase
MENQGLFSNARASVQNGPSVWWKQGVNPELVRVVENGRVKPCRAIELGCSSGKNVVFLAKYGFDVTGVENSLTALELSRKRLKMAGVNATLLHDDITGLKNVHETYDLLVDIGQMHDLPEKDHGCYVQSILSLTHPGSQFFLYCHEWRLYWWEKLTINILSKFGFGAITFEPGEVESRFGQYFQLAKVASEVDNSYSPHYPRGYAAYLMTRKRDVMLQ